MPKLKERQDRLRAKLTELQALATTAEEAGRDFTDDERALAKAMVDEIGDLKNAIKAAQGDDDLRKAIGDLTGDVELNEPTPDPDRVPATKAKGSIGERFVNHPEYKAWLAKMAPNGRIPDSARGLISPAVQFGGYKDLLTGSDPTSGGVFVDVDRTGIYLPVLRRELTLVDFISNRTTTSDTIEYVRQTSVLDAAAPVPEASGTVSGTEEGPPADVPGTKPHGDFGFTKVTTPVRTIAVWVAATKRALSDAGQLRGLIDQELRRDLNEELEDQIMSGDGNGENLEGLEAVSGTLDQPYSATMESEGLHPLLETTRKALTAVRVQGRVRPTAYGMHPADWEIIDLARMAKNPQNEGTTGSNPTLHGLPVFQSEVFTEGVAWAGDWSQAVLWDREQTQIMASDSHADFFIRNLVAILAELRAAFGVLRPAAFIEIDLTA